MNFEGMDLITTCKRKLGLFRIKELKDILIQLGLSRQGKKQDLLNRINALLCDEGISGTNSLAKKSFVGKETLAAIIEDTYRKMVVTEATELSTKGQISPNINCLNHKEQLEDSSNSGVNIRCPCGSSLPTESLVQCADSRCKVKQHISCVIIPSNPMDGVPPLPPQHYCEICRIKRADPFWVTVAHLLLPVKSIASNISTDGRNIMQYVETTFWLSGAYRALLQDTDFNVQAWCIILNDNVPFRMQWPKSSNLQINGISVGTVDRPGSQSLGANGRDNGQIIASYIREGINRVSLSGCDDRNFCLGVRLVNRLTIQQVLSLIPKEPDGELFKDSLARIRSCIVGGDATANEDSDSDFEIIADSVTVNLRCPMSGLRMKIAGRFKPCAHLGCFDLETYVALNERSLKWQCPICLKNYSLEDIIIDPYFNRIVTMMQHCGEDATEIDVKSDGSWGVKKEGVFQPWHLPDVSLCLPADEIIPRLESSQQINQDEDSGCNDLTMKNHMGMREAGIHGYGHTLSSGSKLQKRFNNCGEESLSMSNSSSAGGRDDGNPIKNQKGSMYVESSPNNGKDIDYVLHNFDSACGTVNNSYLPPRSADIIVLSDSEEEKIGLITPKSSHNMYSVYDSGCSLLAPHEILDPYPCDKVVDAGDTSFGMPQWPFSSGSQAGPQIQLQGTGPDVSAASNYLEHVYNTCPAPVNVCKLTSKSMMNSGGQILGSSVCYGDDDMSDSLVDKCLAFVDEDSSLRHFLPTQRADASSQFSFGDQAPVTNGIHIKDHISLRIGGTGEDGGGDQAKSTTTNCQDYKNWFGSNEASLHKDINDEGSANRTTNRTVLGGKFSIPPSGCKLKELRSPM